MGVSCFCQFDDGFFNENIANEKETIKKSRRKSRDFNDYFQNVRLGIGGREGRRRRDVVRRANAAVGFCVFARPQRRLHPSKRGEAAVQNCRQKGRLGRIDHQLWHHCQLGLQRSDAQVSPMESKRTSVS